MSKALNGGNKQDYLQTDETLPKLDYYCSLRPSMTGRYDSSMSEDNSANYNTLISYLQLNKDKTQPTFKPSGKETKCQVINLDGSIEDYSIDKASYGLQLFEKICLQNRIEEDIFFGVTFRDQNSTIWLEMDKKISKQMPNDKWVFEFVVKYYPYDVDSLRDDLTRYFLCLQIRQDLISSRLKCTVPSYVILGAYVAQSEAGDFDEDKHTGIDYIKNQPFAPKNFQTDDLLYQIVELHKLHKGLSPEDADRAFLNNAKKLSLYGIDFHTVIDDNGGNLQIGVYYDGFAIYKGDLRIKKISWRKIIKFSMKNKEFQLTIRPTELDGVFDKSLSKAESVLIFKCKNKVICERLYQACVEHHKFFRLRDREAPKKPTLLLGFGSRTYTQPIRKMKNDGSIDNSEEPPILNLAPPSVVKPIQRRQTQRKPRYDDDPATPMVPRSKKRPVFPHEKWEFNVPDATVGIGIDSEGLDVASKNGAGWQGVRANKGLKGPGKYYFETQVIEEGPVMIGWSSNTASYEPLGSDKNGFGMGLLPGDQENRSCVLFVNNQSIKLEPSNSGLTEINKSASIKPQLLQVDDFVGCLLKFDDKTGIGTLQWTINGVPVLENNQLVKVPSHLRGEPLFPTISMQDSRLVTNFGDSPFRFSPPADYMSDEKVLEPWIPAGKAPIDSIVANNKQGWRMNPWDADDGIEISETGLDVQSKLDGGWSGARANQGVFGNGKYYFEIQSLEDGSDVFSRIGWSTEDGSLDLGTDNFGYGFGADLDGFGINGTQGKKVHSNEIENYGEAFKMGDTIGCIIDLDNGKIYWSKNDQCFDEGFLIDSKIINNKVPLFPTCSLHNSSVNVNFGNKPFNYPKIMQLYKNTIPLAFAPQSNVAQSKKRKPGVISGRYIDIQEIENVVVTDRVEDDFVINPTISLNLDKNNPEDKSSDVQPTSNESTNFETDDNSLQPTYTEIEIDEFGNKRTIVRKVMNLDEDKSKITERQEVEISNTYAKNITPFIQIENDEFDKALDSAILFICEFDTDLEFFSGDIVSSIRAKIQSDI